MIQKSSIFLFFLFFQLYSTYAQIDIQQSSPASIDISIRAEGPIPNTVYANTPFQWDILIRWFGESNDLSPQLITAPVFKDLQILSSSTHLKTGSEDNRRFTEKTFSYSLLAAMEGDFVVDRAEVAFANIDGQQDSLSTERTVFTVLPEPFSFTAWIADTMKSPVVLALSLLVIFLLLAVTWLRRNRIHTAETEPNEILDEAEEIERWIQEAHKMRVEGDYGQWIQNMEKAVRASFQDQFPDKSYPLLIDYKEELSPEQQHHLQLFIDSSVHMKYAPGKPSADVLDRLYNTVTELITKKQHHSS
jgi:hypothetical protein